MEKTFCVISHTHWDREWYLSFESFQIKLVQLVDNLLEILDSDSEFLFHLDAQTIMLEDYLEIKPYNRNKINAYVREGRILIGPWYVQNDFYLTSGESTIRNLLLGISQAEQAGRCTYVGYLPDQFGLISQLPQIFKGFDIDNCIFGRGYDFFEMESGDLNFIYRNSEFTWSGPDGSSILAVHIPHWYNNAQRFSKDPVKSMKLVDVVENSFEGIATTPFLLLMNGVDHLEAQEDLLPILKDLNDKLPEGKAIMQIAMDEYVGKVKNYLDSREGTEVETYRGEMRNGKDKRVLQGTLSSRVYLKVLNSEAQNCLENYLEPLYSMIWIAGARGEYPIDFLRHLWKSLIKNHPHDSICGCSVDEVHEAMEDRYKRFFLQAEDLADRGRQFLMSHVDRGELDGNDYLISVFNTMESDRSGVIAAELLFPVEEDVKAFDIYDVRDVKMDYSVIGVGKKHIDMFTPINLPGTKEVDSYRIRMKVDDIPAFGFITYVVRKALGKGQTESESSGISDNPFVMENDFIRFSIGSDGKADLLHKDSGMTYRDFITFEDREDCGDSYVYMESADSKTYTTEDFKPEIIDQVNTEKYKSCTLRYDLYLPEGYDFQWGRRSDKLILNRVSIKFSIDSVEPWLNIDFSLENASENHRLRVLFNTGIDTEYTFASSPFDLIRRDRREINNGIKNGTQPNSGYLCIEKGGKGLALFNNGLYEYEHLMEDCGVLAVTLLRANGLISVGSKGGQWRVPGNQCKRTLHSSIAVYPYSGDSVASEIAKRFKEYRTPLSVGYQAADLKKFSGGRVAVQDTSIAEVFYRDDKYPEIELGNEAGFLKIHGKEIVVSAVKRSERGDFMIIRLFNTSEEMKTFTVSYFQSISELKEVKLNEKEIGLIAFKDSESGDIQIMGKEILTLAIR